MPRSRHKQSIQTSFFLVCACLAFLLTSSGIIYYWLKAPAGMTQVQIDAKVADGITKALTAEKTKQSQVRISVEKPKPKQVGNIAPNELLTLFHSIKRKELVEIEQESLDYEKRLLAGKERFPSDAELAEIKKWSVGNFGEFHSSSYVYSLHILARENVGYVAYAKEERVRGSLDNSDFFVVMLNGYKKYPGLQNRDDLLIAAEAFGKRFPIAKPKHVIFNIADDVLYCDEDKDNMLCTLISNIYRKQLTTEPYRNAQDK